MTNIILIRHGESEGNVDKTVYYKKYDHEIKLTPRGEKQAETIGLHLKPLLSKENNVYISPYTRTAQTWENIKKSLKDLSLVEEIDARIREQEHTKFKNDQERIKMFKQQKQKGKFWYRFKHGEAGCDVFSRVRGFIETLAINMNLYQEKNDTIIVCHEIVIRCFLMKALNLSINSFDLLPDIENCQPIVLKTKDMRKFVFDEKNTFGNKELKEFLKNRKP